MECSCQIDACIDYYDQINCCVEKIRKARKTHNCCECGKEIKPGDQYEDVKGIWAGNPGQYRTCLDCASVRTALFCSWIYTELWEDIRESLENPPSIECLNAMTPRGKEMVLDAIQDSWDKSDKLLEYHRKQKKEKR